MGINRKWNDTYTTTTTTGDPIEIKALGWKIGDKIELNSPIDIEVIEEPKGWICPKCGRANAPWIGCCSCQSLIKVNTEIPISSACKDCSNHPSNGGSGICNCTLGTPIIIC